MLLKRSGDRAGSRAGIYTLTFFVVVAALTLLLSASAGAATKSAQDPICADSGLLATGPEQTLRVERATRCLINRERTKRGLKSLRASDELLKASDWQNNDMLKHAYFDHSRRGGPEFAKRILRFGYAAGANGYLIGENIAWASQPIATPRKMVSLWMNSPPHRRNILTSEYRDQAVSAVWSDGNVGGAYESSGGPFLIYTNQFGTRY